jgi:hypothetical protein
MKKKKCDSKKQLKVLASIMVGIGIFIWLMSGSEKTIVQDLIKGMGIFLFIVGIINLDKFGK